MLSPSGTARPQGKVTYNVTMSLADLAKGKNSYYVLQLIEKDGAQQHPHSGLRTTTCMRRALLHPQRRLLLPCDR